MQSTNIFNYQPNFKRLITGESAKRKLCSATRTKHCENQFINLKKILYKNHYSKAKNIDAVIEYRDSDGFYLSILSKNGTIPASSKKPYFKNIINTEQCIKELTEWINFWDYRCKIN